MSLINTFFEHRNNYLFPDFFSSRLIIWMCQQHKRMILLTYAQTSSHWNVEPSTGGKTATYFCRYYRLFSGIWYPESLLVLNMLWTWRYLGKRLRKHRKSIQRFMFSLTQQVHDKIYMVDILLSHIFNVCAMVRCWKLPITTNASLIYAKIPISYLQHYSSTILCL